jgi:hypothetical protein
MSKNKNERMHGGGKKVNRGPQARRRNQSLSMVAIAKLVCWLQNKKHFGFRVSQQAVPFSNRRAQQGARADAGDSASCFLVFPWPARHTFIVRLLRI